MLGNLLNLFQFAKEGIYCICCLKNNKKYIGSSASFLERAARHWLLLKTQNHECLSLQQDFNIYGEKFFLIQILIFENNFKKRLELEKQLIS